jgi:hypothetical protein
MCHSPFTHQRLVNLCSLGSSPTTRLTFVRCRNTLIAIYHCKSHQNKIRLIVKQHIARPPEGGPENKYMPFPTNRHIDTSKQNQSKIPALVHTHFSALPLRWSWDAATQVGNGFASEDVWSRKAREKRKKLENEASNMGTVLEPMSVDDEETAAIGFRVTVTEGAVELRWVKGLDQLLYESLCGNVSRLVAPPPPPATAAHATSTERKKRQRERKRLARRDMLDQSTTEKSEAENGQE